MHDSIGKTDREIKTIAVNSEKAIRVKGQTAKNI